MFAQIDGSIEMRLLESQHAEALDHLDPGDLTHSQGEWLFTPGQGQAANLISKSLAEFRAGTGLRVGIWVGEVLVGTASLNEIDQRKRSAGLGYALAGPYRGRGIMTEACRALISHGFSSLKLNRITIIADPRNIPSCAIAERLGFTREGLLRELWKSESGWGDGALYSILAREWKCEAGRAARSVLRITA